MTESSFIYDSNYIIILYREQRGLFLTITIIDYTNGDIITTINNINIYAKTTISPDGRSICYSDNGKDIRILGLEGIL